MTRRSASVPMAGKLLESLLTFGRFGGEDETSRGARRVVVGAIWISLPAIGLNALVLVGDSHYLVALVAGVQAAVHLGGLLVLRIRPRRIGSIMAVVFATDIIAGMAASYLYGGLVPSGATIVWAIIAVLGPMMIFGIRLAAVWYLGFVTAVILAASMPAWVAPTYVLNDVGADLALNLIGATFLTFLVLGYFVRQRDRLQRQSDQLLINILPREIAQRLKTGETPIADEASGVSVLFADIVDFTPLTKELHAGALVRLLNQVFQTIDELVNAQGLEKIKTIGDEYMVAAGVPVPDDQHATRIAELAIAIRDTLKWRRFDGHRLTMRIGVSSGSAIAGVIGDSKFAYDLWGTTVNTASRLQSAGAPGEIHVSEESHALLKDHFQLVARPPFQAKGLGVLNSYTLIGSTVEPRAKRDAMR